MEDGDADGAVFVDVWVAHLGDKFHARGVHGIVEWENHLGVEDDALVDGVDAAADEDVPVEEVGVGDGAGEKADLGTLAGDLFALCLEATKGLGLNVLSHEG